MAERLTSVSPTESKKRENQKQGRFYDTDIDSDFQICTFMVFCMWLKLMVTEPVETADKEIDGRYQAEIHAFDLWS